jgi:predicted RNA-binding protein Jag
MNQTIISKGNNVKEAINLGLEILGATNEEVLIEIIQKEKKGILHIGSKPAIVKLTKIKTQKDQNEETTKDAVQGTLAVLNENKEKKSMALNPSSTEELEGKVWVKNGQLFYKTSPFLYPTVTIGRGVKVFKNHQLMNGTIILEKNDQIDIQVEKEQIVKTKWSITIDEKKLNVILQVEPGMKKTCKLSDIPPSHHIELNAEEQIEIQNDIQYKQILQKLKELNVVHGLDYSKIVEAVNTKEPGSFIIAKGVEPKEGKNGWVELIINTNQQKGPKLRKDGTVDFRELTNIPTVTEGQVIAVVHPPVRGVPGITVTNEPILPKEPYPVTVRLGKGVSMVEEGTKIVATETGRPHIEQKGQMVNVSVIPKFIHHGDVDVSTGNIRFKGDIDITGSVQDEMNVEADGNIVVFGNVNRASVTSKQSIFIHHNVIGSIVSAGENHMITSELIHLLSSIEQQLKQLIFGIKQIMTTSTSKEIDLKQNGLFSLIKLLLDQKFRMFPMTIKQYIDICRNEKHFLEDEWMVLAEQLQNCFFSSVPNDCHSLGYFTMLLNHVRELLNKHQDRKSQDASVELLYALNSTIYCSGDITILGQGCYNSKIHAGGLLRINGVLRGGEVYARGGAVIKEVGSPVGVSTFIMVPHDQTIKMERVWEGTTIQIGKVKYSFYKELRFVEVALNEQGQIIFS